MTHYTLECKVSSMGSWRRPLYTGRRSYYNQTQVNKRIRWLRNEYGEENIATRPMKGDPLTTVVYVRVA